MPRQAWQHCCHRVFTCQILMNMHCVLCFLSLVHGPLHPLTSFCPHHAWCTTPSPHPLLLLPHQHHLTCPAPFHHHSLTSPPLTPLYVLLHGLWPRRLAWHWPPTPQDHSGTLGAEEFKACLISLGFDIANDAQVLNCSHTLAVRGLTGFFFFCFSFALFPPYTSIPPLLFYSCFSSSSLHLPMWFPPHLATSTSRIVWISSLILLFF